MRRIASSRPTFEGIPEILRDLEEVLRSGQLMLGRYLQEFEQAFAQSVGTRYAVGVNSCTSALEIVLRYLQVEGQEVVVPTNTFIATANAVLFAGGTPIFADINADTCCLDANGVRRTLSDRTKAVIVVHLAGLVSPDLPAIRAVCEERGIPLIEDCAHAHGAAFGELRAGSIGRAGCFSFYPTKIMTTGTGGMVTTNDATLDGYARSVRAHGRAFGSSEEPEAISRLGNDWLLDEVRSVLGLHQLRQLQGRLAMRQALADEYRRRLRGVSGVTPLQPHAECRHSYYKFLVRLDPSLRASEVKRVLNETYGIEAERLYDPPCHLQPVYRDRFGFREGLCPVAERVLPRQLCLPLHPSMTADDVGHVVSCLQTVIGEVSPAMTQGAR